MLGYRGNGGIRPYNDLQIWQIVGLKEHRAKKFIRKMISLGIMARATVEVGGGKEVQYYVNPIYFFSSNRIPLSLYLLFRHELDKVLPAWVKAEYFKSSTGNHS